MALAPFSPGGVHVRRTAEMFVQLRQQGIGLERQLTTGKKADNFADLGFMRRTALDLRGKLATLQNHQNTIKDVDLRLKLMLKSVEGLQKIASDTRAGALQPSSGVSGGRPLEQTQAQGNLKLAIDLLNSELNGRFLFSGRTHDQKPVLTYDAIVEPLRDLIAQAKIDADAGGTGFLTIGAGGATASVGGGGAAGFQIAAANSSSAAITVGAPADFTVTGPPAAGSTISLRLTLPDGSEETITLTAAGANGATNATQFGVDPLDNDATAANIAAALTAAIGERAGASLASAAAVVASQTFFADPDNWYNGDDGNPADARLTSPTRIDDTQVVGTGAQANEPAFRTLLTQLAALAADDFSDGNQNRLDALLSRVASNLSPAPGQQKIEDVGLELGNAHVATDSAKMRHQATTTLLQHSLGDIEDAPTEEVAAKLLALQTRLQASYQTTSLLSRLSLVNYL